jgi:hypothetical protein
MSKQFHHETWADHLAAKFPPDAVLQSPFFPELLNQPDLVIVPEAGQMIALFAYFPKRTGQRRPTYQAIEDIFEAKLGIGEKTTVWGVILDGFSTGPTARPSEINDILES